MAKLIDPDDLSYVVNATAGGSDEMELQTGTKTLKLLPQGTLSDASPGATSGVTGKCVYSKLKEIWNDDNTLNKFRFPIQMIYEASFVWINGWGPADDQTRDLFRDAGFQETDGRENACIISLGAMVNSTDQGYYTNVAGFDQTKIDFDKTGEIDENIQIKGTGGSPDNSGYLKCFLREEQLTFASYNLLTEQGLTALKYEAYRLPLANDDDSLKCVDNDATIAGDTGSISGVTYSELTIDYIVGNGFTTAAAQSYSIDDVVQDGVGRWARCTTAGTVTTPGGAYASFGGTSVWEAYPGERLIGSTYYAYNRILDVEDVGNTKARLPEIHSWAQYQCRQTGDINDDVNGDAYGTVNGNIAVPFTDFVGDTLTTAEGVFIDGYDNNDKNDIEFFDITVDGGGINSELVPVVSTSRKFPFTAAGDFNFSQNFVDEDDGTTRYTAYFNYTELFSSTGVAVTSAAGSTCTLSYTADAGLLDTLLTGDYIYITGFLTNAVNNGLYILTGDPTTNTIAVTKQDGATLVDEAAGDTITIKKNPFESPGAVIVDDESGTDINGQITSDSIGFTFNYTTNSQDGRTPNSDAPITVVAIADDGAQYIAVAHTITESTGQAVAINAVDELNYDNPV